MLGVCRETFRQLESLGVGGEVLSMLDVIDTCDRFTDG
jgi:hypothetical protein